MPQAMEPQPGPAGPPQGSNIMPSGTEGVLLDKSRLDELAKQIDGNLVLEEAVKEALMDVTEEFVDDVGDYGNLESFSEEIISIFEETIHNFGWF